MNNELAVRESVKAEVSGFEMKPRTLQEAMAFCDIMAKSDLVPKDYKDKPGNIMVAIQLGNELGLSPMRALRCIAVINGRASMWGDEMLAMVMNSPLCEYVREQDSTDVKGVCRLKRAGDAEEHVSTFTLEDAKRAGLLGKPGPWQTNTPRMLKLRARGFGLRDKFPDVLAGLVTAEEAMDLPPVEPATPALNILEAAQPLTLKDKLKAKVETTQEGDAGSTPVTVPPVPPVADGSPSTPVLTPTGEAMQAELEAHRAKLRTCERTPKAINDTYYAIPEPIRQDCHDEYTKQLLEVSKTKKK
jgi:hypothetical protein